MGIASFTLSRIQQELEQYVGELARFIERYSLSSLCAKPVDHVAIKAASHDDYLAGLNLLFPASVFAHRAQLNSREITTLFLLEPLSLGFLGITDCLEVMEPRPSTVGNGFVGLEHIELLHPDLNKVAKVLTLSGVTFTRGGNSYHRTVELKITHLGQELKFTDCGLREVIKRETADGLMTQP